MKLHVWHLRCHRRQSVPMGPQPLRQMLWPCSESIMLAACVISIQHSSPCARSARCQESCPALLQCHESLQDVLTAPQRNSSADRASVTQCFPPSASRGSALRHWSQLRLPGYTERQASLDRKSIPFLNRAGQEEDGGLLTSACCVPRPNPVSSPLFSLC